MEDSKIVEINLSGLKDELSKNTDDKFKRIEELLMKREEAQSLSESKSYKPEKFDYRAPLEEMLHSFRSSAAIRHDNYIYRDRFDEDFNKIANTKWNEETRKTDYSLTEAMVEAIGSLNPDCCIPEVWADKIERDHVYPGSVFLGAWFVNWYDDINGRLVKKVIYDNEPTRNRVTKYTFAGWDQRYALTYHVRNLQPQQLQLHVHT